MSFSVSLFGEVITRNQTTFMPINLTVEIFVDDPRAASFEAAAKTAIPLWVFLNNLDGTTVTEKHYVSMGTSEGLPERFPLREDITVHNVDQALAIGHILKGWTLLSILKRVEISSNVAL